MSLTEQQARVAFREALKDFQDPTSLANGKSVLNTTATIGAGSAVIGQVSINQTTPGTTNFVQNKAMPDATATFAVTPYASAVLEASAVIKASAGVLYGGIVTANTSGLYFQVFNSATVPVDTTVPTIPGIPLTINVPFSFDMGTFGNFFSAGISVCVSTTQFTKTVGGANAAFYIQKA